MSLAKLTSLSTQTLSLLLERQRLQTMSRPPPATSLPQITRNLDQLRFGILDMERRESTTEASKLLRSQHERMRGMLGDDMGSVERMPPLDEEDDSYDIESQKPSPIAPPLPPKESRESSTLFMPYTDDPASTESTEPAEPMVLLQHQRQIMDQQDFHLENLSKSVNRQRDISIQINDELDVHSGLLEELDHDLDNTGGRLSSARKRLERFSRGIKGNCSVVTIGVLIFVLLILIIAFKT